MFYEDKISFHFYPLGKISEEKKELTFQDYVEYSRSGWIGRMINQIKLGWEGKGWWLKKSDFERLASQMDLETIVEINERALPVLQAESAAEIKKSESYHIALEAKLLTDKVIEQRHYFFLLKRVDCADWENDEILKAMYLSYVKLIADEEGPDIRNFETYLSLCQSRGELSDDQLKRLKEIAKDPFLGKPIATIMRSEDFRPEFDNFMYKIGPYMKREDKKFLNLFPSFRASGYSVESAKPLYECFETWHDKMESIVQIKLKIDSLDSYSKLLLKKIFHDYLLGLIALE